MKWFLLIVLLLSGGIFLAREILQIGEAQRAGADPIPHFRRFRRRVKGLFLLLVLFVLAFFYENFAAWGQFDARTSLIYFLGTLVVLIWLLLVATRDARAVALEAIEESRRLTDEAMKKAHQEFEENLGGSDKDGKAP